MLCKFLLFECLSPKARKVCVDNAPKSWRPPHDDTFGGPRVRVQYAPEKPSEVAAIMETTPEQVKHNMGVFKK